MMGVGRNQDQYRLEELLEEVMIEEREQHMDVVKKITNSHILVMMI